MSLLDDHVPYPKFENGVECSGGVQCLTGFCVDSVCCNRACESACEACSAERKIEGDDGECGTVDPSYSSGEGC
jgi:hypothetical protein